MAEIAPLYAVLVLLYLIEGLVWVPSGGWLLAGWLRGRRRLIRSEELPGTVRGGLWLIGPAWLGGETRRCGPPQASDEPAASGALAALRASIASRRDALSVVRFAALAECIAALVVFPALTWWRGFLPTWKLSAGALVVTHIVTLTWAWRAHRVLRPAERRVRRGFILRLALSPPAAMRAAELLTLDAEPLSDPLVTALAEGAQAAAQREARRRWAEAHAEGRGAAIDRWLASWGLDPGSLAVPPRREHEGCVSYCPGCHAQFTRDDARCGECGGLAPMRFNPDRA